MKPKCNYRTYEEYLIEWLQKDLSRAERFLSVELEEYASDDDLDELLHSLYCIATAKGEPCELVDSTIVDKGALDSLLMVDPNPGWDKVLEALGYANLEASGELIPSF